MKKFYSTAIAALCALGVSANLNVSQLRTDLGDFKSMSKAENVTAAAPMKNIALKKIASRADGDATVAPSISGEYLIYIGDYYVSAGLGNFELRALVQEVGNKIIISCQYFVADVEAKYDPATGKITFTKEKLGEYKLVDESTVYVRFEPFMWDATARKPVSTDFEVVYDAEKGLIEFPEDHGFSWAAYGDSRYGMPKGYLRIFDVFEFEDATHWNYLGNGIFKDNAVGPALTGEEIPPYDVAVFQSTISPDFYMVTDPWFGTYEALGVNMFSPTIYLEATDKDNVLLVLESTGVTYQNDDSQGVYLVTNDGFLCEVLLEGAETPQAYTTLKVEGNKKTFTFNPQSLFLVESATGNAYPVGRKASTLVIGDDSQGTGVNDITVDENAPVEYFNLQGVRIDNPAAGQVVIKRQGSKVTKTLVR
ncbi:MAG: hypothetical protein K2J12_09225 [Muribaculaceae bacterium]|nr:hypothetical protein [Muribaculaceae bacterium]